MKNVSMISFILCTTLYLALPTKGAAEISYQFWFDHDDYNYLSTIEETNLSWKTGWPLNSNIPYGDYRTTTLDHPLVLTSFTIHCYLEAHKKYDNNFSTPPSTPHQAEIRLIRRDNYGRDEILGSVSFTVSAPLPEWSLTFPDYMTFEQTISIDDAEIDPKDTIIVELRRDSVLDDPDAVDFWFGDSQIPYIILKGHILEPQELKYNPALSNLLLKNKES